MSEISFEKAVSNTEIKRRLDPSYWDEFLEYLSYFIRVFLLVALFYVIIRQGVFDSRTVSGLSMYPYLNYDENSLTVQDVIYLDLLTPKLGSYQRGDVVVINRPLNECPKIEGSTCNFVKRVIGLPGEQVGFQDGKVFIYSGAGQVPIQLDESGYLRSEVPTYKNTREGLEEFVEPPLGPDEYYLLGDNRMNSYDSRAIGPIKKNAIFGILGREVFSFVSFENRRTIRFFERPKYNIAG